jgi:hypothetical protein
MNDRFVIEVLVTRVDPSGDELELVTIKSPQVAVNNRDIALAVATSLSTCIVPRLIQHTHGTISHQYPSKA